MMRLSRFKQQKVQLDLKQSAGKLQESSCKICLNYRTKCAIAKACAVM